METSESNTEVDGAGFSSIFNACGGDRSGRKRPNVNANKTPPVLVTDVNSKNYVMSRKRGKCVIFNHENFTRLPRRDGTSFDRDDLAFCFGKYGYDVECHNDLRHVELIAVVQRLSEENHSEFDSLVCCFLTHGEEGRLWAKDTSYPTANVIREFKGDKCPTLRGKPKIFIIQACQGYKLEKAAEVMHLIPKSGARDVADSGALYLIPTWSDIFVALSSLPGFFSWRDKSCGSWFIQSLVEAFEENANENFSEDLDSLMTIVRRKVAYKHEVECTREDVFNEKRNEFSVMQKWKQIPCCITTLLRKVYFPAQHE